MQSLTDRRNYSVDENLTRNPYVYTTSVCEWPLVCIVIEFSGCL